jgi:hypothetical protein
MADSLPAVHITADAAGIPMLLVQPARVCRSILRPQREIDEPYNSNIFATTTQPTHDLITALSRRASISSVQLSAERPDSSQGEIAAGGVADHSEQGTRFHRRRPARSPRRPAELLSVPPHDRGRRLQPNADAATLVDIRTFGGDAPDDIFGGQYRCHLSPP